MFICMSLLINDMDFNGTNDFYAINGYREINNKMCVHEQHHKFCATDVPGNTREHRFT